MADAANTFTSLAPLFKESYGSALKTHKRPGKEIKFKAIREKLKHGNNKIQK